jgi:hypothetical protein
MVTELITEKRQHVRNWMWKQRLERTYSPHAGLVGDGSQLHFVLGVAGGGADHLARLVACPEAQLRFFYKPLSRFEPRLILSGGGDRLAMPFTRTLDLHHPVSRTLRMLVEFGNTWATEHVSNRARSVDAEWPCLVAEPHALLATEALLCDLHAKALLYVTDPVKAVDNLLDQQGLDTPYLELEARSVLAPYFLARFLRRDFAPVLHAWRKLNQSTDTRRRKVLRLVLVAALIQHMFRMLSLRYPERAILVDYDRLARDPMHLEGLLEQLFGEPGIDMARTVMLRSTFVPDKSDLAVWKLGWPEQAPVPRFLSSQEVQACYQLLRESGLGTRGSDQSQVRPSDKRVAVA